MRFTFAIALLAAVTVAGRGGKNKTKTDDFVDFAVKNGKNYKSVGEFKKREVNFLKSEERCDTLNKKAEKLERKRERRADKKAARKAARFAVNWTSDLDDEEFKMLLGLRLSEVPDRRLLDEVVPEEDGRRHLADDVDLVADGWMVPVKNQGQCGSCWAFAAASALEGAHAMKYNLDTPVRLSEQSAVDCIDEFSDPAAYGCRGGWMTAAWDFWRARGGAPSNANYPYTGQDGRCRPELLNDPVTDVSVAPWVHHSWAAAKLRDGPMTIAVVAGNACFRDYASGILDSEFVADCNIDNTRIDHAVVITGYTNAVEGIAGEPSCEDERQCNSAECTTEQVDCRVIQEAECTDPKCETSSKPCGDGEADCTQVVETTTKRRRATRGEKNAKTCADGNATIPNKRGRANKQCYVSKVVAERCPTEPACTDPVEECATVEVCPDSACTEVPVCTETDGTEGTPAFWTIQNSWRSDWGDRGFLHIEATDDERGLFGMNYYIQQPVAA